MKKRIISFIGILLLIVSIPTKFESFDDWGTKIQKALLYTHVNFNQLEWWCQESKVFFFPNNKWNYEIYYKQICENKENNNIKNDNSYIFIANGMEPFWDIKIQDNILSYSSPETYDEETDSIKAITYTITKTQDGNNYYFEWKDVNTEFIKKDCITDWVWDTLDYTVKLVREWDMVYKWCGYRIDENIANDEFFIIWKEKPIKDLEKKLDIKLFEDSDSREDIFFSISDLYKNYVMFSITDQSWMGYSTLCKKEWDSWKQIWEGQDISEEACQNIKENYSDIIHWRIFADCQN